MALQDLAAQRTVQGDPKELPVSQAGFFTGTTLWILIGAAGGAVLLTAVVLLLVRRKRRAGSPPPLPEGITRLPAQPKEISRANDQRKQGCRRRGKADAIKGGLGASAQKIGDRNPHQSGSQ